MTLKQMKLVFGILLFTSKLVFAQNLSINQFKVLQGGTASKSTIIALVDQETLNNPSLVFNQNQLTTHNTSAYLFINTISMETLYTELNHLTRSNAIGFNKDALQLIIIGTSKELKRYQSLDLNYFNTHYFCSLDNSKANKPFITVKKSAWNCEVYLESIKGKHLWVTDKARVKTPYDSLLKHEEGRLTLGYRPVINIGLKNNNLGNYFTNGLSLDYSIGKNIQLYTTGSFTVRRLSIEDQIQDQIFSQINIRDILFGAVTEQEVTLSIPLRGKFYASGSLGIRYLFTPDKDFTIYASTELSPKSSTKFSGQLDTTFNLVIADAFGGPLSNDLSSDDVDVEAIGIELEEAININSGLGVGFQYKLGGHWRFDLSLNYSTSIISVRSLALFNNNALNIAFGLNYRFKEKKEYAKVHFY